MFEGLSLKLIEAGLVLVAGALFGWWQLTDVKREQKKARARRAALQGTVGQSAQPQPHPQPHPQPPDPPPR